MITFDRTPIANINVLNEERIDVMSDRERKLKKKLIKLLKDDGNGHYHAMYAKRLEQYDINIVPSGKEPSTAAISFDEGIIYINEDFLSDPDTFYQLNVLMRHELCHNLMMHQIRMMHHISNIPWSHLKMSNSIHQILNIIEDFEISNKRYSKEDKEIVKHMWLGGKMISGLVTEDHRASWQDLSLEEMYDRLVQEYNIGGGNGYLARRSYQDSDSHVLNGGAAALNAVYDDVSTNADADSVQEFKDVLRAQMRKANKDKTLELPREWEQVIDDIDQVETDPNVGYTQNDIETMLLAIKGSNALQPFKVESPQTGKVLATLYTPEERWLAIETLKIIAGNTRYNHDFKIWNKRVTDTVKNDSELTEDDIKTLLAALD